MGSELDPEPPSTREGDKDAGSAASQVTPSHAHPGRAAGGPSAAERGQRVHSDEHGQGVHCTSAKDVAKSLAEPQPKAETADYLVTYVANADINKAMDAASWAMIGLLEKEKNLSRLDAYSLASMTMDCRVGEMDVAEKSVHCLVPKSLWVKR